METVFKANDGKVFSAKEACEKHEQKLARDGAARAIKNAKIKKYKDEIAHYRKQYEESILEGRKLAEEFEKEFPKEYKAYVGEQIGDTHELATLIRELIEEL